MSSLRTGAVGAVLIVAFLASGCGGGRKTGGPDAGSGKSDALFLAAAPAIVPEELEADVAAMGIRRMYVAGATAGSGGKLTLLPGPPAPLKSPVYFTVMGADESLASLPGGSRGEATGEAWADALAPQLVRGGPFGDVAGILVHIPCDPSRAELLAGIAKGLRKKSGLPVSVTVIPGPDPGRWKPLEGAADDVLAFALGRRPETGHQMVPELTEEGAKAIPLPFRLLIVPGSYGLSGTRAATAPRQILDGEVERLSEDKNLDFGFSEVLSNEVGSLYEFKLRPGGSPAASLLAGDGGAARFQVLSIYDIARLLSAASRWTGVHPEGRVFMIDGLPRDGHLIGFEGLRALLLGRPIEPKLETKAVQNPGTRGAVEFSLKVTNSVPLPTELSRFGNFIRIRLDGGAFSSVAPGDFDRWEFLDSAGENARPVPGQRAAVCKLFENIVLPGEVCESGPIRVAGAHPRVFLSYRVLQTDGKSFDAPETELSLEPPLPEAPPPAVKKRLGRRR